MHLSTRLYLVGGVEDQLVSQVLQQRMQGGRTVEHHLLCPHAVSVQESVRAMLTYSRNNHREEQAQCSIINGSDKISESK